MDEQEKDIVDQLTDLAKKMVRNKDNKNCYTVADAANEIRRLRRELEGFYVRFAGELAKGHDWGNHSEQRREGIDEWGDSSQ